MLIEYGVCGDLILIYPEPYSIYMYNVNMEAVEGYRDACRDETARQRQLV